MSEAGKCMSAVKVGERGQIVIPKEARELFDIHPGDTLIFLGDIERGMALMKTDYYQKLNDHMMKLMHDQQQNEANDDE